MDFFNFFNRLNLLGYCNQIRFLNLLTIIIIPEKSKIARWDFTQKKELLLRFSAEKTVQLVQANWRPGRLKMANRTDKLKLLSADYDRSFSIPNCIIVKDAATLIQVP